MFLLFDVSILSLDFIKDEHQMQQFTEENERVLLYLCKYDHDH